MERYTQKQLKSLVRAGIAIDVTDASDRNAIPENYKQIGFSAGVYGCNGQLFRGESGKLYAVTSRTMAIYIF